MEPGKVIIEFYQLDFDNLLNQFNNLINKVISEKSQSTIEQSEAMIIDEKAKQILNNEKNKTATFYLELPNKFIDKLNEEVDKRIDDLESALLNTALPEIAHREKLFTELNSACNYLYLNVLITYTKDRWIQLEWWKSDFFNAMVNLKFLKYQLEEIKRLKGTEKNKRKPYNLPQKIVLLNELGFFELDKFKVLSEEKKHDVLMRLINEDLTNIKKNINLLKKSGNPLIARHKQNILNYLHGIEG